MRQILLGATALLFLLTGCETQEAHNFKAGQLAQAQTIAREPHGNYFIGRRYYNDNYKFWGYVRRPGQQWRQARLVMFNEKQKLAPDRAANHLGEDNNYEYRLYGRFTGDTVYEPPSNSVLPEFQLTGYELISRNPPPIFAPNPDLPPEAIRQPE